MPLIGGGLLDPDKALGEILTAARAIDAINNDPEACAADDIAYHAVGLAQKLLALDEWIRYGGCLPATWQKPVDAIGTSVEQKP